MPFGDPMRYYVETDGRIYLVPRGECLDLPEPSEIPFEAERIAPLPSEEEVWFCVPKLDRHPNEWPSKDDVSTMPVTPAVRAAVHATMPRVVVEGIHLRDDGKLLIVQGNRGLTKGRWTLPGGFLRFGESPEQGVLRELHEEVGVEARVVKALTTRSKLGQHTQLHWIMLFFRIAFEGEPQPNPDEIAEARYVTPTEAARLLQDPSMAEVVLQAGETRD